MIPRKNLLLTSLAFITAALLLALQIGCAPRPLLTCYQDAWRNYRESPATWKQVILYQPGYPHAHAILVWAEKDGIYGRDYDSTPIPLRGVNVWSNPLELAQAFDGRAYKAWFEMKEGPNVVIKIKGIGR